MGSCTEVTGHKSAWSGSNGWVLHCSRHWSSYTFCEYDVPEFIHYILHDGCIASHMTLYVATCMHAIFMVEPD